MSQPHSNGSQIIKVVRINGSVSYGVTFDVMRIHDGMHHCDHPARFAQVSSDSSLHSNLTMAAADSEPTPQTPTSVVYFLVADSEMHSAAQSDPASEAAATPSPSMSPPTVDLGDLNPQDAFKLFVEDHVAMSPAQSAKFWQRDCMEGVYKVHALPWAEMVEQHTSIHVLTQAPNVMTTEINGEEFIT
eukprot:6237945-Amphidinium_carterae.1